MARLKFFLVFAIATWVIVAKGQEPVLTGPPLPPETVMEVPGQDWFAEPCYCNSYPMYRCEDGNCCNQWWCRQWYGRVELLTLTRSNSAPTQTILGGGGATPLFTTDDIGFKFAPGVSTLLGHRIDGNSAMELVYFGANQWNVDRGFTVGNTVFDASLRSQLHNAEVNYLCDLPNVSLLAGFRYLYWGEQLGTRISSVGSAGTNLSNNYAGGQLGLRAASYWRGLDLEATGKAGLYGNQATVVEGIKNLAGTVVTAASMTDTTVAFIGDLNFSAALPVTRHCRLRAGYNLLYASGLALATNQPNFFAPGSQHVRQDRDVFLHGFNVGLEAMW